MTPVRNPGPDADESDTPAVSTTLLKWMVVALLILSGLDLRPVSAQALDTPDSGAVPQALARPAWYTDEVHKKVLAAGQKGVEVPLSREQATTLNPECMGYAPPSANPPSALAVSAGTCMVSPNGCTMNFIFSDGTSSYIGTAGHCVDKGGDVVLQVGTRVDPTDTVIVTVAKVGRVAKRANNGIGQDFGLVKLDPGWAVVSGVAGALGPTGVFCGDPIGQPVIHYGHGYVFFVEQGIAKAGEVIPDLSLLVNFKSTAYGYNWAGYGLPGDSGSGVMDAGGIAVGDLTHGVSVSGVPIPGVSFGTDMAGIFNIIGPGYSLVTADGRRVGCTNAVEGLVGL